MSESASKAISSIYQSPTSAKFSDEIVTGTWVAQFCVFDATLPVDLIKELFTEFPPTKSKEWSRYTFARSKWDSFIPGFDTGFNVFTANQYIHLKNTEIGEMWATCFSAWRSHPKFIELLARDLRVADHGGITIRFVPDGATFRIVAPEAEDSVEVVLVEADKDRIISELLDTTVDQSFLTRLAREKGIVAVNEWVKMHTV